MKKIIGFLKKEEIPHVMVVIFLVVGLASFGAGLIGPFLLTPEQSVRYYANDPDGSSGLFLAIVVPTIATLLSGFFLYIWKFLGKLSRGQSEGK